MENNDPPRAVPDDAIPTTSASVAPDMQRAVQEAIEHPGTWYVFAGPYGLKSARTRVQHAKTGKRWTSITKEHPDLEFKQWTDPGGSGVFVIIRAPQEPK